MQPFPSSVLEFLKKIIPECFLVLICSQIHTTLTPGNHEPTFCLYRFCFGEHFIYTEACGTYFAHVASACWLCGPGVAVWTVTVFLWNQWHLIGRRVPQLFYSPVRDVLIVSSFQIWRMRLLCCLLEPWRGHTSPPVLLDAWEGCNDEPTLDVLRNCPTGFQSGCSILFFHQSQHLSLCFWSFS